MASNNEIVIALPWLAVVKNSISLDDGAKIFSATPDNLDCLGDFTIRPAELENMFGKSITKLNFENVKWTVIQTKDYEIPKECYVALVDLVSKQWEYEIGWKSNNKSFTNKRKRTSVTTSLVNSLNKGLKLLKEEKRFRIAMIRWSRCYARADTLDTVLDCCSCLEASFSMGDELRLRTALAVYYSLQNNRKTGFQTAYEMYGIRNDFIHGTKIPIVTEDKRHIYVKLVADVLGEFIKNAKMPNSNKINMKILNHFGG